MHRTHSPMPTFLVNVALGVLLVLPAPLWAAGPGESRVQRATGDTSRVSNALKQRNTLFKGGYSFKVPNAETPAPEAQQMRAKSVKKLLAAKKSGRLFAPIEKSVALRAENIVKEHPTLAAHKDLIAGKMKDAMVSMARHADKLVIGERDQALATALYGQVRYSGEEMRRELQVPQYEAKGAQVNKVIRKAFEEAAKKNGLTDKQMKDFSAAIDKAAGKRKGEVYRWLTAKDEWGYDKTYMLGLYGFNDMSIMLNMPPVYAGPAVRDVAKAMLPANQVGAVLSEVARNEEGISSAAKAVASVNSRLQETVYATSKVVQGYHEVQGALATFKKARAALVSQKRAGEIDRAAYESGIAAARVKRDQGIDKGLKRLLDEKMVTDDVQLNRNLAGNDDFGRKAAQFRAYLDLQER